MSGAGPDAGRGRPILAGLMAGLLLTLSARAAESGFTIPAQDLGAALLELGRQSGRNLLFRPDMVQGRRSTAVTAMEDVETALGQVLRGQPLDYRLNPDGTILILAAAAEPAPRPSPARTAAEPALEEILVTGLRPGTAVLLEMADPQVTSVLTADGIALAPDLNVAETLGRLAGVNVMLTSLQGDLGGIDRAARAEGQFTAIRGLGSAYNQVLVNGVAVAQSMPYGRDVQLSLLPSLGLERMVLEKTLGADRDGDAAGGVIDVRTPDAFDTAGPRTRLLLEGRLEDQARDYGLDGGGGTLQAETRHRFGRDGALGLAVGAYYGRRHFANSQQTYQTGQIEYRITDAANQNPAGMDPAANLLLTSLNAQFVRGRTERYGTSAALDWRPDAPYSGYARLTWARADTEQDVYQMGFQGGRDSSFLSHTPLGNGLYRTESVKTQLHAWFQTNPDVAVLGTAQLGGNVHLGRLTLAPSLFTSWGRNDKPRHIEISFWNPTATTVAEGLRLASRDGYPVPQLGPATQALLATSDGFPVSNRGEHASLRSRQDRRGGALDLRYELGEQGLTRIEGGIKLSDSDRTLTRRNQRPQDSDGGTALAPGTTLGDLAGLGLVTGRLDSLLHGRYDYGLPLIDHDRLLALFTQASRGFVWTADAWNGNSVDGGERVLAGYAQARILAGGLEILPGLRLEQADLDSRYWLSGNDGVPKDGIPYGWNDSRSDFTALLPRLQVNYRPDGRTVYRAGLWTSQTRPSPHQLAGGASTDVADDGSITISRGNPDLKAVDGLHADLSAQWRRDDGAHASLALFHKRLWHYLYDAGANYATPTTQDQRGLRVTMPINGGTARIWGAELTAGYDFHGLPAPWDGLSVETGVTWQATRVRLNHPLLEPVERLQYAPDWQAVAQLLYARDRFSAALSYRWTGDYIQEYGLLGTSAGGGASLNGSALDVWVRASRRLDLEAGYRLADHAEAGLSFRNLLGDLAYRATIGRHTDTVPETIDGGRTVLLSLRLDY
ncbi:TonB-dependent receptor [Oleisolibacter albus]|uniref:TonB-dependent receptor n=1 Tax=Oleisolibacter albus TaxID=2171757 RepID=UPI001390492D|nr:TonB-dependent receptor [Oleisolibacter albus]